MKLVRTIVKHSKTCFERNSAYPWSGLITGAFYGNHAANQIHGGQHKWYTVSCNDPNCKAIRAIHIKIMRDLASLDVDVRSIDYETNDLSL